MSLRRVAGVVAVAAATILWMSCGQIYRPVVIPINNIPPNPENFHAVFSINANVLNLGSATASQPGTAMQIDVSGDSDIGAANMGVNPTHAGILPNDTRVFVANAGSVDGVDSDSVTAFFPATDTRIATGLGTPVVISLPTNGAINPSNNLPYFCPYLPDFIATSQNTAVYVANYGSEGAPNCNFTSTDSIAEINPTTNSVINIAYQPAGTHPVAMVETPNASNLYVANQGNGTVSNLSPTDLSLQANIPLGTDPTWMVTRPDGQRVYVITQGESNLYTINTVPNSVMSVQSIGAPGANYMIYDTILNRLYVTNPTATATGGAVYVFDATVDPPNLLQTVTVAPPPIATTAGITTNCATYTCSYGNVSPVSVTAIQDGTRFYVSSYVVGTATSGTTTTCPDATVTAAGCIIPQVTVYSTSTFQPTAEVFPVLIPPFGGVQPFAMAPATFCSPNIPYSPTAARFRMSAVASEDGSKVYTSLCDGGTVAVITTATTTIAVNGNTPDTLVTDLATPFGAGPPQANGEPLTQFPLFLLMGQ